MTDPCANCIHKKRIPDGAGITDGCYHRGVTMELRYPECWEPAASGKEEK
jgi:hypothetical protein